MIPARGKEGEHRWWPAALLLVALPLTVFRQVGSYPFIPVWDDSSYITENPAVLSGLTRQGASWAVTTFHAANWHPLTWLSHMADVELFGAWAGGHHLATVALHGAGTMFLFLALLRMTGAVWRSFFVAALFAVHPLHVESVAWVSERKDVLCGLFWMLALWEYAGYARRPSAGRYVRVLSCFALALLSKPMAVTLPFALLLLDYWPLGRVSPGGDPRGAGHGIPAAPLSRLLAEKIPFLALSAASCAVTVLAQGEGGAMSDFSPGIQASNAALSYVSYLWKTVWPANLSAFYPHPGGNLPAWKVTAAGIFLASVTFAALRGARRFPFLPVGWFWFLGTLVPVLGIVQVGGQGMANRYTYIPLVGIFLVVAWGIPEVIRGRRWSREALFAAGTASLLALSFTARVETGHWRSGEALFTQALRVTSGNWLAHNDLGREMLDSGRIPEAEFHFREAIRIRPAYADAYANLGVAVGMQGNLEEGVSHLRRATELDPRHSTAYTSLGLALGMLGRIGEAVEQLRIAVRLDGNNVRARTALGLMLERQGSTAEAIEAYREALRIRPDFPEARSALEAAVRTDRGRGGNR